MNNKNTYLDKILTLPSKKIINQWFRTIFLFTIIFLYISLNTFIHPPNVWGGMKCNEMTWG